MHKGKIKVFFHQSGLVETAFTALNEDQQVEFEVEKSDKGPRAISIHVVQQ